MRTGSVVTRIDTRGVTLKSQTNLEEIEAQTVLWAAGVQASPLGRMLAEQTGTPVDLAGRVSVTPQLDLPNHPEIFVIGDMAKLELADGQPLPALAPVAMQQGSYAARLIVARLRGKNLKPFRYRDFGRWPPSADSKPWLICGGFA